VCGDAGFADKVLEQLMALVERHCAGGDTKLQRTESSQLNDEAVAVEGKVLERILTNIPRPSVFDALSRGRERSKETQGHMSLVLGESGSGLPCGHAAACFDWCCFEQENPQRSPGTAAYVARRSSTKSSSPIMQVALSGVPSNVFT